MLEVDLHLRLELVGDLKDARAAPGIAACLDRDGAKASAALRAIGRPAATAVHPLLKNPSSKLRAEACRLLKEIGGPGHPWHGRSRIVAIEPNTAVPADGLTAADARGEAHRLTPGSEHHTWLTVSLFEADERAVRGVAQDGSVTR